MKTYLPKERPSEIRRALPVHPLEYLGSLKGKQAGAIIASMGEMVYPADPITEPEYVGKTYLEVAAFKQVQRAADGSMEAFNFILDRTIGKPVSTNLNLQAPESYTDYLLKLARAEGEVLDVESSPTRSDSEVPWALE